MSIQTKFSGNKNNIFKKLITGFRQSKSITKIFAIVLSFALVAGLAYLGFNSLSDNLRQAKAATGDFVIRVKTNNTGASNSTQFAIPTIVGAVYNYNVDCDNNGTFEVTGATGSYTCNYTTAGTYTVVIQDNTGLNTGFPRIHTYGFTDGRKILSIEQWGFGKWTNMAYAFYEATNMVINATDVPNLSLVTNMSFMFFSNASLVDNGGMMNSWNTSSVTNMGSMFHSASVFNQPIGAWNTANVTNISSMFQYALAFNQPIGSWNTEKVTNLYGVFFSAHAFNQPIGSWNTTNVTYMGYMFANAYAFNQPIGTWNTANVTNMAHTFNNAQSFNQPIASWNTANVTNMYGMLSNTYRFTQPIGTWNTANVTDMGNMFFNAPFNQPIGSWNVGNVTNMGQMFRNAQAFNQPIGTWNTANVTDMYGMFRSASAFNQPIGVWNTANVIDMYGMFRSASAFNQPIGTWNISKVTSAPEMLDSSGLSTANYDSTLTGWSTQTLKNGVTLGAIGRKYCTSQTQRQSIISTYGWIITGDTLECILEVTNSSISSVSCNPSSTPANTNVNCTITTNVNLSTLTGSINLRVGNTGTIVNCPITGTSTILACNNIPVGAVTGTFPAQYNASGSGNTYVDGNNITVLSEPPNYVQTLNASGFNWIDATNGTNTGLYADDNSVSQTLPFNFTFYGNTYNSMHISSNGLISFDGANSSYTGFSLPSSNPLARNIIAPYWADLYNGGGQGTIYTKTIGTPGNQTFVIQWNQVQKCCGSGSLTFQVLLNQDGTIVFQYLNMSELGSTASIGVADSTGTVARQATYGTNILSNNYRITYNLPAPPAPTNITTTCTPGTSGTNSSGNTATTNVLLCLAGGNLTIASPTATNFNSITVATAEQNTSASLENIVIEDLRGSEAGWSLVCKSSNLAGVLDNTWIIPVYKDSSSKFNLTPTSLQVVNGYGSILSGLTDYANMQNTIQVSDSGIAGESNNFSLASYSSGFGVGKYTKNLNLGLTIPPYIRAQAYVGNLICSVS